MNDDFRTILKSRRSHYEICAESPICNAEIEELVQFAIMHTPSAFNSQSARVVVLFNEHHKNLWEIAKTALSKIVKPEQFAATEQRINSFAAGYGTILFFEDQQVINQLQQQYPQYKDDFPWYSANSTGMLQLVVWAMLQGAGLGANIQHYSNLIHKQVTKQWQLDENWQLIAQMPFGKPTGEPPAKETQPISLSFKSFS